MYLAKVIGKVVSVVKHSAYEARTLLLVQPISLQGQVVRTPTVAVDYVGAGEGDTVLVGSAPGAAQDVFDIDRAPIRELIMGIVNQFDVTSPEA
ncbi:ethanolamine utilization protein EutN [Candidatus Poribacteria bacterium]|nr:ethanolamine utilization protein EutN [Candidatus Poribacteria bacterium]